MLALVLLKKGQSYCCPHCKLVPKCFVSSVGIMFSFSLTMLHKLPKNQHPHIPNQNYNRSLVDIHFSWTAVLFMTFHSQLSLLHWMRQRSNCFWQGLSHGVTFSLLMVSSSMWTASRASNNLKKVCQTQDCSVSLPRIFHHGQLCKGLMTQKHWNLL